MSLQWKLCDPDPPQVCGEKTRSGRMTCELPPGHHAAGGVSFGPLHYGRNKLGQWRTWKPREKK